MSDATWSAVPLSSNIREEKKAVYLDTCYFELTSHSIANMPIGDIWNSKDVRPLFIVNVLFRFKFKRVSELDFHITCFQCPRASANSSTPSGYKLEFHCSINHFSDGEPKVLEMQSHILEVTDTFSLDTSYKESFPPADLDKPFELKILIKMTEYYCAENQTSACQNDLLQDRRFKSASVKQDLAYILRIPRFEIFTGRQIMGLSGAKMKCIINAADHSEKIANILRALDARIPVSETELSNILNFVLKNKTEYMTDEKLIHGYVFGHFVGLSFIVELSQELIMLKLPKNVAWGYHSFLIDALVMADSVNDCKLFEAAARKFDEWEGELDNPEALIKAVKERGTKGKFTLYTLRRRHKKRIEELREEAEDE